MASQPYTPKPITDIFTSDTSIDRRQCHRTVPMRVLALGLGRTGTASLRAALKDLSFTDTYHMMSASVENPPDCLMWQDAFAAKFDGEGEFGREQWDQLLGHCQAVCDWPAVAFAKELIEAYPEAKVILTTRDVDSWHASTLKTVDWRVNDQELEFVSRWDWGAGLYQPMLTKFWDVFFKGDFRKYGKAVHREYYAEVRNDTDGFVDRCKARNRAQMMNVLFRGVVIGGGILAVMLSATATYNRFGRILMGIRS